MTIDFDPDSQPALDALGFDDPGADEGGEFFDSDIGPYLYAIEPALRRDQGDW